MNSSVTTPAASTATAEQAEFTLFSAWTKQFAKDHPGVVLSPREAWMGRAALASHPVAAAPVAQAASIKPWQQRRAEGVNFERAVLDHIADLEAALRNIVNNAVLQPDAGMGGKTDCYAVPLDDVEAAREAIRVEGEPEESFYRRVVYNNGWNDCLASVRAALQQRQAPAPRCPHCDGTGSVHRPDGEYMGECDCEAEAAPVASAEPVAYLYGGDFYLPDEYALTPAMKANAVALYEHPVAQATPAPTAEPVAKGEPREIRNAAGELVGIARRSCAPGLASPSPHPVSIGAEADKLHAAIMNLPCTKEPNVPMPSYWYKRGHRDARHAAAKLVNEFSSRAEGGAAEAKDALRSVAQTLAWQCFGECRGFDEKLLSPNEALERARAVLATPSTQQETDK